MRKRRPGRFSNLPIEWLNWDSSAGISATESVLVTG